LQANAIDSKRGTIIDRQVTAVLTPGTLLDEGMLEESCNNFLVAIFPHADENGTWGLAYSDISTGTALMIFKKNRIVILPLHICFLVVS
jgi:DNA mismatch repair protein MutS